MLLPQPSDLSIYRYHSWIVYQTSPRNWRHCILVDCNRAWHILRLLSCYLKPPNVSPVNRYLLDKSLRLAVESPDYENPAHGSFTELSPARPPSSHPLMSLQVSIHLSISRVWCSHKPHQRSLRRVGSAPIRSSEQQLGCAMPIWRDRSATMCFNCRQIQLLNHTDLVYKMLQQDSPQAPLHQVGFPRSIAELA